MVFIVMNFIWENTMKGHIGYAVLFMPIFLQSINAMKNLLIAKGKIINPLYDSEEKRNFLLFRAIIELIICAVFVVILFIVLGYNHFAENAINPFIILFLLLAIQYFFLGGWLILVGKNKVKISFYDSDMKKQKALREGGVLLLFSCFILLLIFLALH